MKPIVNVFVLITVMLFSCSPREDDDSEKRKDDSIEVRMFEDPKDFNEFREWVSSEAQRNGEPDVEVEELRKSSFEKLPPLYSVLVEDKVWPVKGNEKRNEVLPKGFTELSLSDKTSKSELYQECYFILNSGLVNYVETQPRDCIILSEMLAQSDCSEASDIMKKVSEIYRDALEEPEKVTYQEFRAAVLALEKEFYDLGNRYFDKRLGE